MNELVLRLHVAPEAIVIDADDVTNGVRRLERLRLEAPGLTVQLDRPILAREAEGSVWIEMADG